MNLNSILQKKENRKYLGLAAILLILVIASSSGIKHATIQNLGSYPLPSFQGLHFIFVGFQPANSQTVYTANSNATVVCPYDPSSCSFIQSAPGNGQFANAGNGQ